MAVTISPTDNASVWGPAVAVVVIAVANLLAYALNEQSWPFRRWLRPLGMPRLLFISNRSERVTRQAQPCSYWGFDLLDPLHLVQAPIVGTAGLLVLHAVTFLFCAATVIVDVGIDWYGLGCHFQNCYQRTGTYLGWMTYLTNWSIALLGVASLVGCINVARHIHAQRKSRRAAGQGAAPGCASAGRAPAAAGAPAPEEVELGSFLAPAAPATARAPGPAGVSSSTRDVHTSSGSGGAGDQQSRPSAGADAGPQLPASADADAAGGSARRAAEALPAKALPAPLHAGGSGGPPDGDGKGRHGSSISISSSSSSCDTVVLVCDPGNSDSSSSPCKRLEVWDALSVLHCLLLEVATTAAFFVSLWFWVGLDTIAGEDFNISSKGGAVMAHAGNLGVALLQLLLSRLPIVSTHFQVVLWYATLYEVFLWAYGEGSGTWRYGLDWRKATPAGALVLLPLVVFIMFCIWFLLAVAREAALRPLARRRRTRRTGGMEQGAAP